MDIVMLRRNKGFDPPWEKYDFYPLWFLPPHIPSSASLCLRKNLNMPFPATLNSFGLSKSGFYIFWECFYEVFELSLSYKFKSRFQIIIVLKVIVYCFKARTRQHSWWGGATLKHAGGGICMDWWQSQASQTWQVRRVLWQLWLFDYLTIWLKTKSSKIIILYSYKIRIYLNQIIL